MPHQKIIYEGKQAKFEIFNKHDKLFKSLSVHQEALKLGLRVPKLYKVDREGDLWSKTTEWVEGDTIHDEMTINPKMIEVICPDLARYINELYDANQIAVVDNHFKNFVWHKTSVVCIDLKKLLHETYDEHIMRMSKLCLKNCRGKHKKRMMLAFLKGYDRYKDVRPVIAECDRRKWGWEQIKGGIMESEPIKLEDIR